MTTDVLCKLLCAMALTMLTVTPPAKAQRAILPHGDPTVEDSPQQEAQDEEIRSQRLKQQGQGEHYRIEGTPQPGESARGEPEGGADVLGRQDTGLSDPSVNPGQAAATRTIRGEVLSVHGDDYAVRDAHGQDVRLFLDPETTGDRDIAVGDRIVAKMTRQGRVITIQKDAGTK